MTLAEYRRWQSSKGKCRGRLALIFTIFERILESNEIDAFVDSPQIIADRLKGKRGTYSDKTALSRIWEICVNPYMLGVRKYLEEDLGKFTGPDKSDCYIYSVENKVDALPYLDYNLKLYNPNSVKLHERDLIRNCMYCGTKSKGYCNSAMTVIARTFLWRIERLPKIDLCRIAAHRCVNTGEKFISADRAGYLTCGKFPTQSDYLLRCPQCGVQCKSFASLGDFA